MASCVMTLKMTGMMMTLTSLQPLERDNMYPAKFGRESSLKNLTPLTKNPSIIDNME